MEFLFLFIGCLALSTILVHGQDQSGFISMDCGMAESSDYNDTSTGILYTSDAQFIDTGIIKTISADVMPENLPKYLSSVRAFPEGLKNCYTIKVAEGNKYLIRAVFMYGNYDSKNQAPEFGLYLNADEWDSVKMENSNDTVIKEIIHVQITDYLHVCLVNTGMGTPFISALELRKLNASMYETQSGSLALARRLDIGSTSNDIVRYKDDIYDRIWEPYRGSAAWESLILKNTSAILRNRNYFIPPSAVMRTAVRPKNRSTPLELSYTPDDDTQQFYVYMHFAEIEDVNVNRSFSIWMNGGLFYDQYLVLKGPSPLTVYSFYAVSGTSLDFSFYPANDSILPPILNAIEFYLLKLFMESPTEQNDVEIIREIKSVYGVKRNWQGDPCAPKKQLWDGLECSYHGQNFSRIISLDLSSSQLSGKIDSSLSKLKSLQYLDLSNNNLTGEVPEFLTQLPLLKTLNLSGNEFTGSVPSLLIERSKNGSLTLSVDVSPIPCAMASCKKKKSVIIPVVASIASVLVLLSAVAILLILRKTRRGKGGLTARAEEQNEKLEPKSLQFSYSELVNITNNFKKVIGKGGSGTVYGGCLKDGTQVAVKMLSKSSQGPKEFQTEAQLMMKIHHRNLASLIGYCNEGQHLGLVYEYMANGNLQEYLSTTSTAVLSWDQRLRIAVDAAQALEYLHNGCKPPIIHRDVKTSNILLDEKLLAKVTDFGSSRIMPVENGSHVSTAVVGTVGYIDPEYYRLNKLNEKSDVYNFGIVLLELVTGQPAIIPGHERKHITQWLNPMLTRGEIRDIVDSRLSGGFSINSAWKILETAMACVVPTPMQRPTMNQVVLELKECLDMDICSKGSTTTLERKEHHVTEPSTTSNDGSRLI